VRNFVIKYFTPIIFDDELIKKVFKYGIKQSLRYFDKETYMHIDFYCNTLGDEEIRETFGKEIEFAKVHFDREESANDIPF